MLTNNAWDPAPLDNVWNPGPLSAWWYGGGGTSPIGCRQELQAKI